MQVQIDEETLKQIAEITSGTYYRATDKQSLEQIFAEIDELEKTKIEVKKFSRFQELFPPYLVFALGFIVLEIGVANTRFRKIP
jgi:Ca-activated chloride channel family protein